MTCHHTLYLGTCDEGDCPGPEELDDMDLSDDGRTPADVEADLALAAWENR